MVAVLYVHGKGGDASECKHYKPFFLDCEVIGLDYRSFTPWDAGKEIYKMVEGWKEKHGKVIMIANSIGAYFSMCSHIDRMVERAFFISPIVDMEKLICDMMDWAGVTEKELKEQGVVHASFGEDLSWDYLCWVRAHPMKWDVPTDILYGEKDTLTSFETVKGFACTHNASLTVMEGGEHWFHTEEQMRFLDEWLCDCLKPQKSDPDI